jgi:Tfp pilus assembly protein FimT
MKSNSHRGFSLLEMMIVIFIGFTVAAFAVMTLIPTSKGQHVTTAYNTVLTTMRHARDQSAADMRIYVVSFATPGTVTVTQNTLGGTLLLTSVLPSDVTFHVEPGVPTSNTVLPVTPDSFGTASVAFDFDQPPGGIGGGTAIYFYPDGTAKDINGNTNNGVVYMGRVGDLYSSRAITVWGSTGRLRGWRLQNISGTATWREQ